MEFESVMLDCVSIALSLTALWGVLKVMERIEDILKLLKTL
ncbi:MAG: hypothetical protein QXJ72_05600 [Thermoproteota archaeon]